MSRGTPQESQKSAAGGPWRAKMGDSGRQETQNELQEAPGARKELGRRPQEGPKRHQKRPRRAPERTQEPPKAPGEGLGKTHPRKVS